MALLPLRTLSDRPIGIAARDWLDGIASSLDASDADRNLLCRRVLTELWYPEYAANWESAVEDRKLAVATRLALSAMDPCNVTLGRSTMPTATTSDFNV